MSSLHDTLENMTTTGNTCLERRVGRCRCVYLLTVAVIFAVIAISTIIAVTLSIKTKSPSEATTGGRQVSKQGVDDDECIDVAVIGGGIGGAYTGWRLKDRGLSISVFEYSDRIGGRLYTGEFPVAQGTYLEFGGMRFKSRAHPTLNRTASEIGLNIIPFELGYGNTDETMWYARNTRMRNTDLGSNSMPYNLPVNERKGLVPLIWDIISNSVNFSSNTYPSLEEMYTLTTTDGIPLYKMSLDNFYGRYASREAYKYIFDTSGWVDSVGRFGGLVIPKLWAAYPGETGPSEGYKTIEGGMAMMPKTLIQKFLDAGPRNKLHLNHQLLAIERRQAGGYHLSFRRTNTVDGITMPIQDNKVRMCAKKVVLAVQRRCIEDIDFPVFRNNPDIVRNFDSVIDIPAGRIYLAYETKWWKTNNSDITHSKSDLPNRQTYDWSTGTNNVSIIMGSYHDGDLAHYWRELSHFGTPIPGSLPGVNAVTDVVKNRIEKYLSLIYDYKQEDIPEAVGGGMMLWDSYPFYAGWSYFKPGFDERRVRELVERPSPSDDVYIVSNCWSKDDLQGWAEGSLVAVDQVIKKYF